MAAADTGGQVNGASILIIDDDTMLLKMTEIVLQEQGFSVATASSAKGGMDAVRAAQGSFDLVLVDMRMPDGDGPDVIRQLHKEYPTLRMMLVTGYAACGVDEYLEGTGAIGVIEKPYNPDGLVQAVRDAMLQSVG